MSKIKAGNIRGVEKRPAGLRSAKGAGPSRAVLDAMGPTIDEVIAEEFDTAAIARIQAKAATKADRIVSHARVEAAAKSASIGILRALREAAGLTQAEMARRLDVSPPAIHQMETSDPKMSSVLLYAEALGESLSLNISGPAGKSTLPFGLPVSEKSRRLSPVQG
jgi:DNA-binding XRE family transcriptional regulator